MSNIEPEYLHLCSLSSLPKRFGKRFELEDGIEVALFQVEGNIYAVDNVCPHQKFPLLHEGEVEESAVTCPMHGWKFDLVTGKCLSGGNATLKTYEVMIQHGEIHIEKPKLEKPKWME